ncbi:uncharacterized protein [Musca autumnalis]|uniref:uncharacterized protein n=1 Tax=Musca autumnalis TaxID=221902 RepID=UPI003CE7BE7D
MQNLGKEDKTALEEKGAVGLKKVVFGSPSTTQDVRRSVEDRKKDALLYQIENSISKFKRSLEELQFANEIYWLESLKHSWERLSAFIENMKMQIVLNYPQHINVVGEADEVEVQYHEKLMKLLKKIGELNSDGKLIKVPNVKIPDFYGSVEEWSTFHDLYKKLVHEDERLSAVEKHVSLEGSQANNYEVAWDILKQRYENKRILFQTTIDRLLDQQNVSNQSSRQIRDLLDTTIECVLALKAMDCEIDATDPIIARIIIRKLDKEGLLLYEQFARKSKEIQKLDDVLEFLEERFQNLEEATKKYNSVFTPKQQQTQQKSYVTGKTNCNYCQKVGHLVDKCQKYLQLTVPDRLAWAKKNRACFRCLRHNYTVKCESDIKCRTCGLNHHPTLHENKTSTTYVTKSKRSVLLATAQVRIKNIHGEWVTLKALIDQGSQTTFITEEAAQILQMSRIKTNMELHGLGEVVGVAKTKINVRVHPRFPSKYWFDVEALVLPTLASVRLDSGYDDDYAEYRKYELPDPNYNRSERIDLVLGGDVYVDIIESGVIKKNGMLGQNTKLVLMLSGPLTVRIPQQKRYVNMTMELERFWEIEEVEADNISNEDEICLERHASTTRKNAGGRFVVQLSLKDDKVLGESYRKAMARFVSLEKNMDKNMVLKTEYSKIMEE